MKVLKVEPNKAPHVIDIDGELESLQKNVNGYIEIIYPFEDNVCIICNEEGKINGSTPNRPIRDEKGTLIDIIFDDFLIVGLDNDDELCNLTDEQINTYTKLFNNNFVL